MPVHSVACRTIRSAQLSGRVRPISAAPWTTAATDAVGFPARATCGVGEVLNAMEPTAPGAAVGSDDRKSISRRSERRTRSAIALGDAREACVRALPGRPVTGLNLATHGSHVPSCVSTTPTRFEGATASPHVLIGQIGSECARSRAS